MATMIIVLRPDSTDSQIDHVLERIRELGLKPNVSKGEMRTIIGVIGDEGQLQTQPLSAIPCVEQAFPILKPLKLASREMQRSDTVVEVGRKGRSVKVGGGSMMMV